MKLSAMLPPLASSAEPIDCVDCGAKNPANRKFCGKCGSQLWDPCLQCGQTNPAQEEFCGHCGVALQESLRGKIAEIDETISRSSEMFEEYQFREALNLLGPLESVTHPRLLPVVKRANELLERCSQERLRWNARIREVEQEVEECNSPDKLGAALQRIREIPALLRTQGLRDFLREGEQRQAEIATLSETVARAGAGPLTAEVVQKVERLLFLQPGHEEASKLALVVNRSVMRKLKALALQGDYEKALEISERVPESFCDKEFRSMYAQLADLGYLAWDIKHAPLLDNALFLFAQQLRKRLPQDSPLMGLCQKLLALEPALQQAAANRRWMAPPETSPLGPPMEFLADLGPIQVGKSDAAAALAENPGRFAVACGLALQGLGLAPLPINLLPEETRLGKIGRWFSQRKSPSAWGIEISSSGIKGVKLKGEPGERGAASPKPTVVLEDCRVVEHRRHLTQSTNEKDRENLLEETLVKFLEQNHLENTPVVVALPDWMVLLKTVELPPMPLDKREQAIAHESRHLFPTPMPEVAWKHARFDAGEGEEAEKRPFTVAYVGVRQPLLKEFVKRWAKAGLRIAAVQCDMAALYNFAMFHAGMNQNADPIALVDLGADRLNVLVCSARRIWHRSVMFGADRINKALVREFQLTYGQAEQWKCNPTLVPSLGKYYETLQPTYDVYMQETRNSLGAYRKAFPDDKIARIVGCGGGFAAHDLPRYFLWQK